MDLHGGVSRPVTHGENIYCHLNASRTVHMLHVLQTFIKDKFIDHFCIKSNTYMYRTCTKLTKGNFISHRNLISYTIYPTSNLKNYIIVLSYTKYCHFFFNPRDLILSMNKYMIKLFYLFERQIEIFGTFHVFEHSL